jgi:hypothetical protein
VDNSVDHSIARTGCLKKPKAQLWGPGSYLLSLNLLSYESNKIKRSREVIEMEVKLRKFGFEVNWENN